MYFLKSDSITPTIRAQKMHNNFSPVSYVLTGAAVVVVLVLVVVVVGAVVVVVYVLGRETTQPQV